MLRSQVAGTTDVEVTLTPEEIEGLDDDAIKKLYAQKLEEIKSSNRHEDFSVTSWIPIIPALLPHMAWITIPI